MSKAHKFTLRTLAAGLFLLSGYSQAADPVALWITGNVVASPCQVSQDSASKIVNIGDNIQASTLQTAGAASDWVNFDLSIHSCPAGSSKATITMHGTPDTSDKASLYKNMAKAGFVAVQVQMVTGEAMGDGKSYTGTIVNNAYTYKMRARAYTATGGVTPGDIRTSMTATFTYQ